MIDLEERLTARMHARVVDITVEPDLGDVVARAGSTPPEGRVSRRVVLGAAAALVAVAIGGLVVIGGRTDESPMPFGAEPPEDATGSYPVIDEQFLPAELRGELFGSFTGGGGRDQGWTGVVGVVADDGLHKLISITAWPRGHSVLFPEAETARRDDVREADWGDAMTLIWEVDGQQFTMVGDDRNTMYELIDTVEPINEPADRMGYSFAGILPNRPAVLPNGLQELAEPEERRPGTSPMLSTGDGRLNIEITDEAPLVLFAANGTTEASEVWSDEEHIGYVADPPGPGAMIAVRINESDTLIVDTRTYDFPELLTIMPNIRFVDEATWREFYDVDFECTGCDGMLTGPPVTPPTTD